MRAASVLTRAGLVWSLSFLPVVPGATAEPAPNVFSFIPPLPPPQSFRSKRLDDGETKCINVCAEKFIKLTSRVALRFQDIQQQKAKDEAAGAGASR